MMTLSDRLSARFTRYTKITSQSDAGVATLPSTEGQWRMAQTLFDELFALGVEDVQIDDHGIVTAVLPRTSCEPGSPIGFVAHVDTVDVGLSPVIHAQKIRYNGGDILLNKDQNIFFDKEAHPEIDKYRGDDIFFSDGTSVLGADNKAAIAILMTVIETLLTDEISHGDVYFAFVPDEETGLRGAKKLDLNRFHPRYAYTIDCCERGELVYETFNAAKATLEIMGVTAHPMTAKGVLVNPILLAVDLINCLDRASTPEHTAEREGYIWVTDMRADQASCKVTLLIRDHDLTKFKEKKRLLEEHVETIRTRHPTALLTLRIEDQYENIANRVSKAHPAVAALYNVFASLDIPPKKIIMRGGTDGSMLTKRGLITPNYFTGAHNFHSKFEFLPMSSFLDAYAVTLKLIENAAR